MGIFKRKKKKYIIIEILDDKNSVIKTYGKLSTAKVCDVLLSSLRASLIFDAQKTGVPLDILKEVTIKEISKISIPEEEE